MNKKILLMFILSLFIISSFSVSAFNLIEESSYTGTSFNPSEVQYIHEILFNEDGTIMFLRDSLTYNYFQYTLNSPYNLSSPAYSGESYTVPSNYGTTASTLANNGTYLYNIDVADDDIFLFELSDPNNISTASYSDSFLNIASYPTSIFLSDDGSYLVIGDTTHLEFHSLSTPWDLDTKSLIGILSSSQITMNPVLAAGDVSIESIYVDPSGLNLFYMNGHSASYKVTQIRLQEPYNPSGAEIVSEFSETSKIFRAAAYSKDFSVMMTAFTDTMYSFDTTLTTNFYLTAKEKNSDVELTNFSAWINGTEFSTTNGLIETNYTQQQTETLSVYFTNPNYFNSETYSLSPTEAYFQGELPSTKINFSATEIITGNIFDVSFFDFADYSIINTKTNWDVSSEATSGIMGVTWNEDSKKFYVLEVDETILEYYENNTFSGNSWDISSISSNIYGIEYYNNLFYVTDEVADKMYVLYENFTLKNSISAQTGHSYFLDLDIKEDIIYIPDALDNVIYKYNINGSSLGSVATVNTGSGKAISHVGNYFYILDANTQIDIYDKDLNYITYNTISGETNNYGMDFYQNKMYFGNIGTNSLDLYGTEILFFEGESNLPVGTHNITACKGGYFCKTEQFSFSSLQESAEVIEDVYSLLVNVTVEDYFSGSNIQNWSGAISSAALSYSSTYSATGGQKYLYLLKGYDYVSSVDSSDEIADGSFRFINFSTNKISYDLKYTVYESNSMIFNVYNLTDSSLITANVDLSLTGDHATYYESFTGGSLNKTDMAAGTYNIRAESVGFSTAYMVASVNGTYQLVDIYLDDSTTSQRTFYIVDNANDNVQEATVSLTLNINGTVVTVLQKQTDLSGSSTFDLDITKEYGVVVTKEGYITYTGTLTPIQTEYTINIQQEGSEIFQSINEDFALSTRLIYTPGDSNAFVKYQTTSSTGSIVYFGVEVIFDGDTFVQNLSGTPGGGTINLEVLINTSTSQLMNITYWYKLTDGEVYSWTQQIFINVVSNENNTLVTNAFDTDGMGNGTKIFIGMFIITLFLLMGFMFSRDMTVAALLGLVGVGIVWFKEFLPAIYCGFITVAVIVLIVVDNMGGR